LNGQDLVKGPKMDKISSDKISEYSEGILNYTGYHFEEGDKISNSPRHAINQLIAKMDTGREFSQRNETDYGIYSIWYNGRLATMRFDDGENLYIGRDVLTKNLLSFYQMTEIVYRTIGHYGIDNAIETIILDDDEKIVKVIKSWQTDTGKRSGDGMLHGKQTAPKVYKRKRTIW